MQYTGLPTLIQHPGVTSLLSDEIERANSLLARPEQVKYFRIMPKELDPEEGDTTPTRKIKRKHAYSMFKDLVDEMYADPLNSQAHFATTNGRITTMSQRIAVVAGSALLLCASVGVVNSQSQQPYVIGYISDFSGPFVDTFSPVHDGFRAHIDAVNAAGGVNGRQIKTIVRDDQLNATRAASLMRELVTSEGVNSIWSLSLSSTLPGVYALAKRLSVPAISSVSAIKSTLPPAEDYAYSTGSAFEVAGEISGKLALQLVPSKGKLMCVTIDSAGGFAACGHTGASASAAGFTIDSLMFPPAKVEYGAIGQRIASSQPAIVVTHLPAGLAPGVLLAARSAGIAARC